MASATPLPIVTVAVLAARSDETRRSDGSPAIAVTAKPLTGASVIVWVELNGNPPSAGPGTIVHDPAGTLTVPLTFDTVNDQIDPAVTPGPAFLQILSVPGGAGTFV